MKIKVAIWDMDENYVRRLLQNFQIYYSEKLELGVFLDAETLHRSIREKQIDMLLIDSRIKIDKNFLPQDSRIIIARLCDSSDIEELEGNPAICKYQKIDVLFKEILSIYADQSPMVTIKKEEYRRKFRYFVPHREEAGYRQFPLHTLCIQLVKARLCVI